MDRLTAIPLQIGAWRVDPRTGQLSREGEMVRVEARTLRLLLCLAQRAGEVVSLDELLDQVWSGVVVTPDSVYQGVASLRRILGDDPKQPTYIATVPRLGYRMVANVGPWVEGAQALELPADAPLALAEGPKAAELAAPVAPAPPAAPAVLEAHAGVSSRRRVFIILAAVGLVVLVALFLFNSKLLTRQSTAAQAPARSVAVLPFLDLTSEAMNEEYFADGMTEELIGKLARIPDLRVPSPTASFHFKGKDVTVADFAHSLGVAYVLDGSVRKSDTTLRISARLIRVADGYVVWSETYDRPEGDKLGVQEDIAGEVAKALPAAIR
jgi:TolB-like protein/DNA-binding winged helix-turn-helix (wHTH) protein